MIQLINVLLMLLGPVLVVGVLAAVAVAFNPPTNRVRRPLRMPVLRFPAIEVAVSW
jgi:hypothetical protein